MTRKTPLVAAILSAFALAAGTAAAESGAAPSGSPAASATGTAAPAPAPAPADVSAKAFERLKSLAGTWQGKSTKGWEERVQYTVIAKESCLMESSFDAHPGEQMITMICPDGDRLLLTHYCVAKNQPRLVLTAAAADLSQMTFEFLDGTNMSSRDKGHMDKVIFKFMGPDRFSSQWTWYQDGKESWMEEIVNTRVKEASAAGTAAPVAGGESGTVKPSAATESPAKK